MKRLERMAKTAIGIHLNGQNRTGTCDNRTSLADFLRHELGATGTHVGCEHGVCGACTVRVEGAAVRACMTLAVQVEGRRVDTVEGLAQRSQPASSSPSSSSSGSSSSSSSPASSSSASSSPASSSSAVMGDLQQAFKRHHALQCGFCTAGILMSCSDFLERLPDPSETEVREMLSGHLCRCTGYTAIVAAVMDVASQRIAAGHAVPVSGTSASDSQARRTTANSKDHHA